VGVLWVRPDVVRCDERKYERARVIILRTRREVESAPQMLSAVRQRQYRARLNRELRRERTHLALRISGARNDSSTAPSTSSAPPMPSHSAAASRASSTSSFDNAPSHNPM
jgi:hypothetical protein